MPVLLRWRADECPRRLTCACWSSLLLAPSPRAKPAPTRRALELAPSSRASGRMWAVASPIARRRRADRGAGRVVHAKDGMATSIMAYRSAGHGVRHRVRVPAFGLWRSRARGRRPIRSMTTYGAMCRGAEPSQAITLRHLCTTRRHSGLAGHVVDRGGTPGRRLVQAILRMAIKHGPELRAGRRPLLEHNYNLLAEVVAPSAQVVPRVPRERIFNPSA